MTAAPYGQVPRSAWEGAETVYFPYSDLNSEIIAAIHQAVPNGATYGFNHDYRRAWVTVTKPGNTRDVMHAAFASLGRDLPDDPGEGCARRERARSSLAACGCSMPWTITS